MTRQMSSAMMVVMAGAAVLVASSTAGAGHFALLGVPAGTAAPASGSRRSSRYLFSIACTFCACLRCPSSVGTVLVKSFFSSSFCAPGISTVFTAPITAS